MRASILSVTTLLLGCGGLISNAGEGSRDAGGPGLDAPGAPDARAADSTPDERVADGGHPADSGCKGLVDAGEGSVRVATSTYPPTAMVVNGDSIYWSSTRIVEVRKDVAVFGAVMGASLEGCGVTTFAMTPANALVVGGATLYFTEGDLFTGLYGGVVGVPLAGGKPVTLATYAYPVAGIATDGAYVYWAYENFMGKYDGALYAAPLGGGKAVAIAEGQDFPSAVAVDDTRIYWLNAGINNYANGAVLSMAKAGGPITRLAMGQNNPFAVAVDATRVYWANGSSARGSGGVYSVPLSGGAVGTLSTETAIGIAIDDTSLYFTTSAGAVEAIPLGGGATTTLVSGLAAPGAIALSGGYVYFSEAADGGAAVLRVAK